MTRRWLQIFLAAILCYTNSALPQAESGEAAVDTLSAIRDLQASEPEVVSLRSIFPFWYEAAEPFRVIGNIYFVGSRGLAMYFIPTSDGHILIDGGVPENAPMIAESIRKLGYRPEDIRLLLNTHSHIDHSGGLSALKSLSGAALLATEGDRLSLESGEPLGAEDRAEFRAPPVTVDRTIKDGEVITSGDVSLTAYLTPGHTRGCTSFMLTVMEAGVEYDVLIFGSTSVSVNRLVDPPQYPGIVDDYRRTFRRVAEWRPDVFLANHPEFFDLEAKRQKLEQGDALAFVDVDDFPDFLTKSEAAFEVALDKQRRAAGEQ